MLELELTARSRDGSGRTETVAACVDSGAARTYLPLVVADRLGICDSLARNPVDSFGVGSTFATWTSPNPIGAQIIATYPDARGRTEVGPELRLRPWFGEPEDFLLGRADFFQAFQITFNENPMAPRFHLDW